MHVGRHHPCVNNFVLHLVSEDFNTTMVVFEIPLGATNDELIFSTDSICLLDNSELHGNITFTVEIVPVPIAFQLGEQNSSTVVFQDDDEGKIIRSSGH